MANQNWQPTNANQLPGLPQNQGPQFQQQPLQQGPQGPQGPGVTLVMPTTITLKDVVVIVTALITIISSWTFYTMRLSVQEQKVSEYKVQLEKIQLDLDDIHKSIQDLRMKDQALEIKQSMGHGKK